MSQDERRFDFHRPALKRAREEKGWKPSYQACVSAVEQGARIGIVFVRPELFLASMGHNLLTNEKTAGR